MTRQKTLVLTGASRGIGHATVKRFEAGGWRILTCSRHPFDARCPWPGGEAAHIQIDLADPNKTIAALEQIKDRLGGRLDALVNNAGITGGMPQDPTTVDVDVVRRVLETNVIGVLRVTNAVLPMLRRSAHPRIVAMSSGVGSLTRQSASDDPLSVGPVAVAYSPSKTMLNAVVVQYAKELAGTGVLVNAACPGYVATDLNGHRGVRTPEQGAAVAIRLATLPDDGPSGGYFEDAGPIPW